MVGIFDILYHSRGFFGICVIVWTIYGYAITWILVVFIIVGNVLETRLVSRQHMNVLVRNIFFLPFSGASWNLCQYLDNVWMCHYMECIVSYFYREYFIIRALFKQRVHVLPDGISLFFVIVRSILGYVPLSKQTYDIPL